MCKPRIVVDTGVAVSAILLPGSIPRQAFDAAVSTADLLVSEATLSELDTVLRRPKFNKYVSEEQRLEFHSALVQASVEIEVTVTIVACRDAKDDKFLELALSGSATCILSGDEDLLTLNPYRGIRIMTPQAFLVSFTDIVTE